MLCLRGARGGGREALERDLFLEVLLQLYSCTLKIELKSISVVRSSLDAKHDNFSQMYACALLLLLLLLLRCRAGWRLELCALNFIKFKDVARAKSFVY